MLATLDDLLESTEKCSEGNRKQRFFLQELALFHPSLKLSPPPQGGIDSVVDALLSQLKSDHPEAGPAYWSNRCWALVYWQPIYLAVYSVHRYHHWVSFSDFQLGFDGKKVSGFYFSNTHWLNEDSAVQGNHSLIEQQALELKVLLESFFHQLTATIKINAINAWRLIADCILMVLLDIEQINDDQKVDISYQWLKAFGLYDRKGNPHSQLKPIYNPKSTYPKECCSLGLDRKSCCMHYLIDSNNPCDSCNKYP